MAYNRVSCNVLYNIKAKQLFAKQIMLSPFCKGRQQAKRSRGIFYPKSK